MKIRLFLVRYRLIIALVLLGLAVYVNINSGFWQSLVLYILSIGMIVVEFMFGPITIIQKMIEEGNIDGAKKLLNNVKFPNLLYKPIRSAYYMLQSNFAAMNQDFDTAERELKNSIAKGQLDKSYEGAAYLQLGTLAYRKSNYKDAYENLRKAVSMDLPDKDSEAGAYIQLSSICMQRRDFRGAKNYLRKAKSLKPNAEELKSQIKELDKYLSRVPG